MGTEYCSIPSNYHYYFVHTVGINRVFCGISVRAWLKSNCRRSLISLISLISNIPIPFRYDIYCLYGVNRKNMKVYFLFFIFYLSVLIYFVFSPVCAKYGARSTGDTAAGWAGLGWARLD